MDHLSQKTAQDVERLAPHVRQLPHGLSVHWVRIAVLLFHLQDKVWHINQQIYESKISVTGYNGLNNTIAVYPCLVSP